MTALSNQPVAKQVDARGYVCPVPVFQAKKAIREVHVGELVEVVATDPTTKNDIPDWVRRDGHELVTVEDTGSDFRFLVKRLR